MKKFLVFVVFLLVGPLLIVFAQDKSALYTYSESSGVRIGFHLTGLINFTHWQTSEYVDGRYRMRPYLSKSLGLFLQKPLAERLTIEAGVSYTQLGLASAIIKNYRPGRRYEFTSTSRSQYNMLALPVRILYQLNKHNSLKKYLLIGTNVYYNDLEDNRQSSILTSTISDMDTGDTLIISERRRTLTKFSPAIVVGAGWEKRWSKKSSVNIRVTACIGIAPIVETVLTFTVLNRSRYYVPYSSTNKLINRGTYIGIELCYLFSIR